VDNTEEIRAISLCTGYGGIELGLKGVIQNLRTVAYVEIEAFACANLVAKIEESKMDAAPIWTNLKTFDSRPFRDRVHLITGGYPCQGESHAGKRLGTEDPRWLWPYIERIVKAVRPVWCFFENVGGHLTSGFPIVYRSLRLMGYKVEAGLFTAAEVGAPHKRQRLFILAYNTKFRRRAFTKVQQAGEFNVELCCQAMADTTQQLCDGSRTARTGGRNEYSDCRWPSRPGQPQYEWEEPRVVEYARSRASKGLSQSEERNIDREVGDASGQGQAQSGVGRAVNGHSSRVDRLRLLGNGVVPQQAEKAFRELIKLFE